MQDKREPVKLSNMPVMTNDLLGTATGLAPWAVCTSPSRLVMLASQIQQRLLTTGMNRPRFFTGQEKEYAKYTFGCQVDFPCVVIAVIDKFETGRGVDSFRYNPKKTLIVKNLDTQEYDVIEYETYCSHHTSFGFEFVPVKENQRSMQVGEVIQRNTRLNRSPGVMPEGDYIWGTRTPSILLSHHAVTEDGFLVSREWCEENKSTGYGEITIMVPKGKYAINAYGSDGRYKPFPLPGESIRKDGLIAALREYDDILGAVELSNDGMRDYNYYFDEKYFIEAGVENARVIDIDIWCSDGDKVDQLPTFVDDEIGEDDVVSRLWGAKLRYLRGIEKAYQTIEREVGRGKDPKVSKALSRLVTDTLLVLGDPEGKRKYRYKQNSIASTYVKISYMYDITPDIGFKLTNMYGFKGVICAIKPRSEMPRWPNGKVADFVGDGFSAVNRMNPSIFIEQYVNYQAEVIEDKIRVILGKNPRDPQYLEAWDLLYRFYQACAGKYLEKIEKQKWNLGRIKRHVDSVAASTIHAFMPSNTPNLGIKQVADLKEAFPPEYDKVSWVNDLGETVYSTDPVIIGDMYLMVLEKTGHDWGAVDVSKRQVHGVPTKPSGKDRHNLPYRKTPFRLFGEAEVRNYSGNIGGRFVADMLDRANNPKAQEAIWTQVINAEKPTDLSITIDRNLIPLGEGMHLKYLNNAMYCSGAQFEYLDTDNLTPKEEISIQRQMGRRVDKALLEQLEESDEEVVEGYTGDYIDPSDNDIMDAEELDEEEEE